MSDDESWGFVMVLFEDEHAAFPMSFEAPVVPQEWLHTFNLGVRSYCQDRGVEYNYDMTTKCALMMLLGGLRPVAAGEPHGTDWQNLTAALMIASTITTYQFFVVRASKLEMSVERLRTETVEDAKAMCKDILDDFQQGRKQPITVYVVEGD